MTKYVEFAVGWLKNSEKKGEYVSAVLAKGNPAKNRPGIKSLTVELDNGETMKVTNFAMFFNENKVSDKAPDVQFTFTTEN